MARQSTYTQDIDCEATDAVNPIDRMLQSVYHSRLICCFMSIEKRLQATLCKCSCSLLNARALLAAGHSHLCSTLNRDPRGMNSVTMASWLGLVTAPRNSTTLGCLSRSMMATSSRKSCSCR